MATEAADRQNAAKDLQAILSSIGHGNEKLTAEQLQKLSERLSELGIVEGVSQARNKAGEFVNEEGLPIVDISEPVDSSNSENDQETTSQFIMQDPDLIPLEKLSPAERAQLREERERFLDALEEEERIVQARDEEMTEQLQREELEKRKEAMKQEMERLKAARDLQKKMGKALVRNVAEAREKEKEARKATEEQDLEMEAQRKVLKPKKSVSFAGLPPESEDEESRNRARLREMEVRLDKRVDVHAAGDVTLGRLRSSKDRNFPTLVDQAANAQPMKMTVVERYPSRAPNIEHILEGDSDDDSSQDDTDQGAGGDTDSPDGEPMLDEGYDLDAAQHQREIALEYYKKKATIGKDVAEAIASHPLEDDWDQPDVPLEATLSRPPPKPPISRFKATQAALRTPATTTASVPPALTANAPGHSVKIGKLVNGQLIGSDSSDGEDEHVQRFMDALKKGEVQNIGPSSDSDAGGPSFSNLTVNPPLSRSHSPAETPISESLRSSPKMSSASALAKDDGFLGSGGFSPVTISSPSFPPLVDASEGPPTVMSSSVTERKADTPSQNVGAAGGRKDSRFKAERTG